MKSSPVAGASRAGPELNFRPSRAQPPRPLALRSTPKPRLSSKPAPAAAGKLQPPPACHHCSGPNTEMRGQSRDSKRTSVRRNSTSTPAPQPASPGTAHLYGTRQGRNGRSYDPAHRVEAIVADDEGAFLPEGRPKDGESTVTSIPTGMPAKSDTTYQRHRRPAGSAGDARQYTTKPKDSETGTPSCATRNHAQTSARSPTAGGRDRSQPAGLSNRLAADANDT
jgi:hypothetical protein